MFDVKKLQTILKKNKNNGQKALLLAAAGASVVASSGTPLTNEPTETEKLVIIGITSNGTLTEEDLKNFGGTGIDISGSVDINTLNNNGTQTVGEGDTIDGGTDNQELFLFGEIDLSGINFKNISKIYLNGELITTDEILQLLKDAGVTEILGDGIINAETGTLDFEGLKASETIIVKDSDGNVVVVDIVEPENKIGQVAISGTAEQGNILTATVTDDDGLTGVSISYEWLRDGQTITSETGETYTLTAADIGAVISVKATYTDAEDFAESLTSANSDAVTASNGVPTFSATNVQINVDENQTAVTTATATDADGDVLTYSLDDTADKALFTIDAATGAIKFVSSPDFETKADDGGDGVYNLSIIATDAGGLSDTQNIVVTVGNVNEAVSFAQNTLAVNAAENQTIPVTSIP